MSKALVLSRRPLLLRALVQSLIGEEIPVEQGPMDLAEALGSLRKARLTLVIVDFVGRTDAELQLLPALAREIRPAALVAVLAVTDRAGLRRALDVPCDALLLDPFDLHQARTTLLALCRPGRRPASGARSLDALAVFLKGVTHEVLNPLTSISGIVQILLHEEPPDTERRGRYQTLLENVERIQGTLRELEHFVRARKPQRQLLEPGALLQELRTALRAEHPPRDLQISADGPSCAILADRQQLHEALAHLARFAAGHPQNLPVAVVVRGDERELELELRGSAPLVLPDDPAELFYPYYAEPGQALPGNLHLSSAFGTIRSHQGTLTADAHDGAVVFRVRLPAAPAGIQS